MFGNESGFGEHFHQEYEEKLNRVEVAENKVSEADFELEVSNELSDTKEFREFIASKKQFGIDMVLYCDGILDYLKKEVDKGISIDDIILVCPGRSGLGIEIPIRQSIRETFGSTPMGIRLATESELEGSDFLTLSHSEGFQKVPIQYKREGNVSTWNRDKILTPQLNSIFKKPKDKVLICDAWKAGGRSLRQVLFTLKPYEINNIVFATAFPSGGKLKLGETLIEPYKDESEEDEISQFNVDELLIGLNNGINFDHIARRIMWIASGITKMPTNQESVLKLNPQTQKIQKRIDKILGHYNAEMGPEEMASIYEEYRKLCKERQALADDTEMVPPPLEFIKGPTNISTEDRISLRFYLQNLGHLAANAYESSK